MLVKGCKVSVLQDEYVVGGLMDSGDLVNKYCIMCLEFARRVDLKCSHQNGKRGGRGS